MAKDLVVRLENIYIYIYCNLRKTIYKNTCSFASSSTNSRGNRSDLVDDNCPSLMKVGPSCNTHSRSHEAVFLLLLVCEKSGQKNTNEYKYDQ